MQEDRDVRAHAYELAVHVAREILRATKRHVRLAVVASLCVLAGAVWAATASYYYDELGRLIETVAADGTSVLYSYDAVGNITSVKHESVSSIGISGFTPVSGGAGTVVTIYGSGFNTTPANNTVKFNGVSAAVTTAGATFLTVTVPVGATTGVITVTNASVTASSSSSFTVASLAAPTIASFTPAIAAAGAPVTISGTNFQVTTTNDKVQFGGLQAVVSTASATALLASPALPISAGKISVTTPYGVATSATDLFVVPSGFNSTDVQYTGRIATSGGSVTAITSAAGKTGLILFDGTVGQTGLYLEQTAVSMPGGTVTVFAPDGSKLGSGSVSSGAALSLSRLPVTGTYTIVIAPSGPGSATLQVGTVDLKISGLSIGTILANHDGSWTVPVSYMVTNLGTAPAPANWNDVGFLSLNGVLDGGSYAQTNGSLHTQSTALAPGANYVVTNAPLIQGSTTSAPGVFTVIVKTDAHTGGSANVDGGSVAESDETNNMASTSVTLGRPDLKISGLSIGTITSNQDGSWSIPVSYTVTNVGTAAAQANWNDVAFLSVNGVLDSGSFASITGPVHTQATALAPGANYVVTNAVLKQGAANSGVGAYTVIVKTDAHSGGSANVDGGALFESDETNNTIALPVTLGRPDLKASALSIGTIVSNQDGSWSIPVSYTVTNIGTVAAQPNWNDIAFLSVDGVLDSSGSFASITGPVHTQTTALAPSASYVVTGAILKEGAANSAAGAYTVIVKADAHSGGSANVDGGALVESDETNNTIALPVTLGRPDLKASGLSIGTIVSNQDGSWSIPVSYTVTNIGTIAAQPNWNDIAFLSVDGVLDSSGSFASITGPVHTQTTALAPSASYVVTGAILKEGAANSAAGAYTVIVKADAHSGGSANVDGGALVESDETNNAVSLPVTLGRPDLKVSGLSIGTITANSNGSWSITLSYTVTNVGTVAAQPNWNDIAFLSVDGVLDSGGSFASINGPVHTQTSALAPGANYVVTNAVLTQGASNSASGVYTVIIKTDAHSGGSANTDSGSVVESDETNNVQSANVTLTH